jgi:hypothetical protein
MPISAAGTQGSVDIGDGGDRLRYSVSRGVARDPGSDVKGEQRWLGRGRWQVCDVLLQVHGRAVLGRAAQARRVTR